MCNVNFIDNVELGLALPEIEEEPVNLNKYVLPQKSKKLYEKLYGQFMEWRRTKNITSFSESVLLVYFEHLSNKMKPPTLWTFFSMLKCTLMIKHRIDISLYRKLHLLLKRKSKGYRGKKSKTFSPSEMKTFINDAPDEKYLLVKVALILGIMGACRRHELHELKFDDVKDLESALLVTIPNTKRNATRAFTVTGKYYEICKKYIKLRPKSCNTSSFFVNYQHGRCTVQNVGINKFGNMGKEIATYLNLPDSELYTGHCFRRSSTSVLVDAGGDIRTSKQHDRWIPTTIAEAYIVPEMESTDEIEIKEEPFHAEVASAEMKLEAEEHPLSRLHLNDEDPTSSMDETNEDLPQAETSRLDKKTEGKHGTEALTFLHCAASENEGCLTTSDSTASCERKSTSAGNEIEAESQVMDWTKHNATIPRQPVSQELIVQEDSSLEEVYVDCDPLPGTESNSRGDKNVDRTPLYKCKGKAKAYAGNNAWEQLAKEKIELVQLKKQLVLKEHKLKVQQMCELNELAKMKLQLEIELLKKNQ